MLQCVDSFDYVVIITGYEYLTQIGEFLIELHIDLFNMM